MNLNQINPSNIPPGILEHIIGLGRGMPKRTLPPKEDQGPTSQIMKRLEIIEKQIAAMASRLPNGNGIKGTVDAGRGETSGNEKRPALPNFLRKDFQEDFKEKPAEAMVNLVADLYGRMPEMMASQASPVGEMMDLMLNISKQVRKDKLFDKFDDAREMVKDIEGIFKEIPEIEKRADAYEVAYKLVKSRLINGGESGEMSKGNESKNVKRSKMEEESLPDEPGSGEKDKAFVENNKSCSTGRDIAELTPAQKEICKKMGIKESTFKKYMRK